MAAEVDFRTVSSFTAISEPQLQSLLSSPTVDAVRSLLQSIETKARDFEQVKTQKVRLEVELETSVRTNESKVKALKKSVEKGLAETSKLRIDLQNSENARLKLESDLEEAKTATTHDASETTALRSRVASLESSNRDTLSLLESKTTAYHALSQELSTQHEKAVDLRKQVVTLEQTIQAACSAAATARFREQNLEQERDLLKKNAEWFENELKTKAAEHLKFRKEKNARLSELNQATEQYISEVEGLRRSETSLRSRLDDQIQKFEDLMSEIQQLREEKLAEADGLKADLDSANRLASLQEEKAKNNKDRADQLLQTYEDAKEAAAEEIGQIRAELETEQSDREAAEQRIAELELIVQQLQSEVEAPQSRPVTPSRGLHGNDMSTPGRPTTPAGIFSPTQPAGLISGLTKTQIYSEYKRLEQNLATERQSTERLQSELDNMLQDLESSRPEIEQLRSEHEKLQSDIVEMSTYAQNLKTERDHALTRARTLQGQVESHSKEAAMLTQQVRDANAQIKVLLFEQDLRQHGEQLSPAAFAEAQQLAIGDITHLSPTSQVISKNLTIFQNVEQQTEQNSTMRRMLRELGEKMEGEEAQNKDRQLHSQAQELDEARAQLALLQDEVKAMLASSKSYMKERDMFRNMLTRKANLQGDSNDFARSLPIPAVSPRGLGESVHGSTAGTDNDYGKLLRDLQAHFDSYRQESMTDQTALKTQVNELSKRNSQLQADASRAISQLSAANQRCEMLDANLNGLRTENSEIQRRSQTFMENATRQELKTQQAAEELIENKGLLDSMRRENANLKAEKDLWKSIERRLTDDTESLRNERGRLDQLNSTLQTMLNEREHSDAETRRRLQAQVESLDSELQITKRKLSDELDEAKKSNLRREYEHQQSQKRIDDLVTTISSVREELSATKSTRDHLQARVDEIVIDLRSAEERVALLSQPATQTTEEEASHETLLSREQELAVEISELKRDLDQNASELARTVEQVEVYKSISQQAEERLQEVTETNEQYRDEAERALEEKNAKIKDLEQRIDDINAELTTTNTELSKLRDEHSEFNRRLDEQKNHLEADIARAKEEAERNLEQAQYNLEASKAQAQIATEAQQNYENELMKHAEAAKTSKTSREEANQLRLDLTDFKTQAETAIRDLAQKEESWDELKIRYERELSDLRQRREEVAQQNTLLHNQLETLTTQISQLQKDRTATMDSEANHTVSAGSDNLQEVIKYLRREKEIVDVQYHLSTQEQKRLRQQLDHVQVQLDDTRLKLEQQRRTEATSEQNAVSHTKLMETLNELNLYRESSVTLRAENKRASDALSDKTKRVEELLNQLQPLQTRIAELENLSEIRDGEMKLLQENRDHWQQRTQNILSKYDRVDPAELELLKQQLAGLETERDEAIEARDDLQAQVDNIPEQIKTSNAELRTRLGEQFKTKVKELNGKIKEKQTDLDTVVAEKDALQLELDSTKESLETARTVLNGQTTVNGTNESDIATNSAVAPLEARIKELETSLSQKEEQITSLKSQNTEALENLKQQLESQHQSALEELRAQSVPVSNELQKLSNSDTAPQTPGTETSGDAQNENMPTITEAQARLLVQKHEVIRRILTTNIKKSLEKKEEALRKEFALAQAAIGDTTSPDQVAELQRQIAAHGEVMKQKEEEFTAEKEALISEHANKLESEKLIFDKDAEKKIADQVALAQKKISVQLNMAQGKVRTSEAKIEVVKKAAEETPEKPVGEVWELAKDAKPAKLAVAPAQPPSSPSGPQTTVVQNGPVSSIPGPPTSTASGNAASVSQPSTQLATTNGVPKSGQSTAAPSTALPKPVQTGIPRGGGSVRGRGGGLQGNQAQGNQVTEVTQAQPSTRGTGIPRGNFRGGSRGRGGAPAVQTGIPPAGRGTGASPRSSLNPAAQNFQPPGIKRAREEGDAGDANKRQRNSGAGQA